MQTFIEALWKRKDRLIVGWNPEPVDVSSYKIYVGINPVLSSLTLLQSGISPYRSTDVPALKKVSTEVSLSSVQGVLGLSSDKDFSNTLFYFAITYVDMVGSESPLTSSILVPVPPAGIGSKTRDADNPTFERFMFGFSDETQKWVKIATSPNGGLILDSSDFYKSNVTVEYTYDGTNLATTKSYPSDTTLAGSPAKLTTYTYSGSQLTKMAITDSTV